MQGPQLDAEQALARLRAGNRRFVDHVVSLEALLSHARRDEHARAQRPFAVVLGCSDSRAPAEFVFDQGLGDLFVIRVAGNIAAPSQVGSVEFAVEQFQLRLVVVLGHSNCGAVRATLAHLQAPAETSPALRAIVDRIAPGVGPVLADGDGGEDACMPRAIRANVRATIAHLRAQSDYLRYAEAQGGLRIVGADYDLASGAVDFFETEAHPWNTTS
ncbi:carbonic anhydrase [Thermomonas aquatica]|uniref:Carbonic anhydrase n=1 Tax=Thermomonas aquatica TaxID=2202149 RepID=A0A5B7ZQN5_9GAMM|nr:carbonic anhydrase [Thermomonas aquatica]QDA57089.1 carbonic anhydrase [Thermomonas aquatica]